MSFALAAASVAVPVAAEAVAAAASGSILTGADVADELAAIAAAAIASGAVAVPDPGVAAGTSVVGIVTVSVTATTLGVAVPPGCAVAGRTVEESVAEVAESEPSVDFAACVFAVPDFALDDGVAVALASLLEVCPAVAPRPSGFFVVAESEAAVSRDRVLSAPGGASSARRSGGDGGGVADGGGAVEVARSLLVSVAALLSTSAPKLSSACGRSDRAAGFGGGV